MKMVECLILRFNSALAALKYMGKAGRDNACLILRFNSALAAAVLVSWDGLPFFMCLILRFNSALAASQLAGN